MPRADQFDNDLITLTEMQEIQGMLPTKKIKLSEPTLKPEEKGNSP